MTWIPNCNGQPIDLVNPSLDQVDFVAMAHALANLNRYVGAGYQQVSVGLHVLIGLDFCPEPLKPYWLLHDGHEERLGEIATPVLQALQNTAREVFNETAAIVIKRAVAEFKLRHDRVIHEAAGLRLPSADERRQIAEIDVLCLAIEHRDFHRPSARKWKHEIDGVQPGRSIRRWQSPDKIAEQIIARFERYLPALRGEAHASLPFEGA
ncbi:hypothetical protein [Methylobacterium gnaphalii]|uniref:Uncharacterized protein n=1 Tax=Methylobacterium gnaphalii TaxID=1010610 RepID=A0A512JPD2_9HYPH|nr:hypothetical protein [Methylobacterium gnaphalii]GEP11792.1 hypothetical protein MGN01_36370 [Methylobacterium gnaphalii]GJD69469.1 hypothetical protein MMMDOFMJ_2400 [Methylobacterium gnaphalii]GLS49573.1 hypothetical protein GCM10007885_24220 [Methylobacterium gnaphalii]